MATSLTLQNDPTLQQGYLKVNGTTAATITTSGLSMPQATIGSLNGILKATSGVVSNLNGFIFVPLNDPTDPLNNNSNVEGLNVVNFTATGNTTTTPYTGATQTANLASIVPNNAYMVLLNVELSCNTEEASSALTGDVYLYFRKNSTDPWRIGLLAETLYMTKEANATKSFPIIFDYTTKTFQIYLYHIKGSAPSQNPSYAFTVNVLGYFIK